MHTFHGPIGRPRRVGGEQRSRPALRTSRRMAAARLLPLERLRTPASNRAREGLLRQDPTGQEPGLACFRLQYRCLIQKTPVLFANTGPPRLGPPHLLAPWSIG